MFENESRHELVRAVHSIHIHKTCIARDVNSAGSASSSATSGTAAAAAPLSCWTAVFAVKAIGSAKSASSSEGTDLAVELGVGSVASLLAAGLAWMFERSGGTSSLAAAAPCSPVAARCSAWARLCAQRRLRRRVTVAQRVAQRRRCFHACGSALSLPCTRLRRRPARTRSALSSASPLLAIARSNLQTHASRCSLDMKTLVFANSARRTVPRKRRANIRTQYGGMRPPMQTRHNPTKDSA